jgi:tetratricopeptide (TPR) repeat protein
MYWQYGHPYDKKGYLSPEYPVQVNFKDYSAGKDQALELILNNEIKTLKGVLFEKGFKSFSEEHKNWSEKYSKQNWWFPYNEFDLRLMGIDLFTEGKKDDAIQLFSFLTNRYPDISWGWQILGNLYAAVGDYENGLACYEKANPDCYYTQKDGCNLAMNFYKNRIVSAFGSGGIASIKNLYLELKTTSHWDVSERLLINVADDYLKTENTTDAIKILQLNADSPKENANTKYQRSNALELSLLLTKYT